MPKYINSTPLTHGMYDHSEVIAAAQKGAAVDVRLHDLEDWYWTAKGPLERWYADVEYRAVIEDNKPEAVNSEYKSYGVAVPCPSSPMQQSDRDLTQVMEALKNAENERLLSFSAKEVRGLLNIIKNQQSRIERFERKIAATIKAAMQD